MATDILVTVTLIRERKSSLKPYSDASRAMTSIFFFCIARMKLLLLTSFNDVFSTSSVT
jgi:hypothetical protein